MADSHPQQSRSDRLRHGGHERRGKDTIRRRGRHRVSRQPNRRKVGASVMSVLPSVASSRLEGSLSDLSLPGPDLVPSSHAVGSEFTRSGNRLSAAGDANSHVLSSDELLTDLRTSENLNCRERCEGDTDEKRFTMMSGSDSSAVDSVTKRHFSSDDECVTGMTISIPEDQLKPKANPFAQTWTLQFKNQEHECGFVQMYYGDSIFYLRLVSLFLAVVTLFLPLYIVIGEDLFAKEDFLVGCLVIAARCFQGLMGLLLAILTNTLGIWMWWKGNQVRRENEQQRGNSSRNSTSDINIIPTTSPRQRRPSSSSSEPTEEKKFEWVRQVKWLANVLDICWCCAGLGFLGLQGVMAGYVYPHRSECLISLIAVLGFRLRLFSGILFQALFLVICHIISLIVLLGTGHHTHRGIPIPNPNGIGFVGVVPVNVQGLILPAIEGIVFLLGLLFVGSQFEQSARILYRCNLRMDQLCEVVRKENDRQQSLVSNVYPVELLPILRREGTYQHHFNHLSIVVNDIARFTQMSVRIDSHLLFWFLNELYSEFDAIALNHFVTKVKTVGDSWVGIVFHFDDEESPVEDSLVAIITACEMNTAFGRVWRNAREKFEVFRSNELADEQSCALRTGVSIGEGWVYVIGAKASKSRLTFDVVGSSHTQASLLEASGIENKVMCCQSIFKHAPKNLLGLSFEETTRDFHGEEVEGYIVSLDEGLVSRDHRNSLSPLSESSEPSSFGTLWHPDDSGSYASSSSASPSGGPTSVLMRLRKEDVSFCSESHRRQCCLCRPTVKDTLRIGLDQFSLQIAFLTICFSNAIVMSLFVIAEVFLLVDLDPYFHASIVSLCGFIIGVSCIGIVFVQAKVRDTSVALVWVVFVTISVLGTVMCLYAFTELSASSVPIRRIANSGFITVLFAANAFPSIPYLVKLFPAGLCFLFSLLVFVGETEDSAGDAVSFWSDFVVDFFVGVCISLFGIYYGHYILLKGYERGESIAQTNEVVRQNLEENERLLSSALPPVIVLKLQSGEMDQKGGHRFLGGILFGIILAQESTQDQLIPILDVIFSEFDRKLLSTIPEIQRIKCSGRRILCVTGMNRSIDDKVNQEELVDHHGILANVAKGMVKLVAELRRTNSSFEEVHIRIGLHVGPFCGGICGTSKWLFDVVGLSINTTCRLAENAGEDEILCLSEFVDDWDLDPSFRVVSRGRRKLKGIEEEQETYSLLLS